MYICIWINRIWKDTYNDWGLLRKGLRPEGKRTLAKMF
jgi:hypothetical protein